MYATARRPGILPLRPLGLADVLEASFAAVRTSPAAVLGTALLVALVQTVAIALPTYGIFNAVLQLEGMTSLEAYQFATNPFGLPAFDTMMWSLLGMVGAALAVAFGAAMAQGVLSVVVARAAAGWKTSLGQAWRLTGRQLWSLVALTALYLVAALAVVAVFVVLGILVVALAADASGPWVGLTIVLLVLACIPVGLWITVKLVLAPASIAVERLGPIAGIARSWRLTRGHWWRTFGIVLLVALIVVIVSSVITGVFSSLIGLFLPTGTGVGIDEVIQTAVIGVLITTVLVALVDAVATAYLTLVAAVLYIDYRIRQESFDLDLAQLTAQAGADDHDARFSTVQSAPDRQDTDTVVPGRSPGRPPGPHQTAAGHGTAVRHTATGPPGAHGPGGPAPGGHHTDAW